MTDEERTEAGSKELAIANEYLHPLVPYGPTMAMREMTRRVMLFDTGKVKMNAVEAAHYAQVCISTRLNPFAYEIWALVALIGNERRLTIMPGRRGLLRHAHEQAAARGTHFWPRYEQVTDPERRKNLMIPDGALAFECKLYENLSVTTWNQSIVALTDAAKVGLHIDTSELGPTPFVFGLGILPADDMRQLDKGSNKMSHVERTQKRAYMMALKQMFDLPLAGAVGPRGETMEDYVPDAEWREIPVGAAGEIEDQPEGRPVKTAEQKAGDQTALYGAPTPEPVKPTPAPRMWSEAFVKRAEQLFVANGIMPPNENRKHLIMLLNLSPVSEDWPDTAIISWGKAYRGARDQDVPSKAAAVMATATVPAPF
jgi:hypothetical protein